MVGPGTLIAMCGARGQIARLLLPESGKGRICCQELLYAGKVNLKVDIREVSAALPRGVPMQSWSSPTNAVWMHRSPVRGGRSLAP